MQTSTNEHEQPVYCTETALSRRPFLMGDAHKLTPGWNVDRIDVGAGLLELGCCGYDEPETIMVIEYALMRWARGEEEAAVRGAIDRRFHGIDLTCWLRVLSAARASAESGIQQ